MNAAKNFSILMGIVALAVATATPSAAAGTGAWVLKSTEQFKEVPDTEGDCYNSQEVTVGELSATTYARCTWTGPVVDVWSRSEHSWSAAPPARLVAGEQWQITSTTSVEGTFLSAALTGGGSTWVRIDLVPGGGPYPGAGWASATEENTPASAVSEFSIPAGGEGSLMLVSLSFQGPGGAGWTTYTYEWQETAPTATAAPTSTEPTAPTATTEPRPTAESWSCGLPGSASLLESLFGVSVALAIDSGARFTCFSGEVTVAPESDLEDLRPASMDMVLDEGNHINTESDSSAIIAYADMTTFIMKPFTTIVIAHAPAKESKLSILTGRILVNVKKMWEDGSMDITMNQAIAGTRGTVFVLEDTGDTSTMKVLQGNVDFTSLATGEVVTVGAGESVTATAGGLSEKSNFDVKAESASWNSGDDGDGLAGLLVVGAIVLGALALVSVAWLISVRKKRQTV